MPPFVNFLRPRIEAPPYEPVRDMCALKDLLMEQLESYSMEAGAVPLDLVLFR